MSPDRDDSCCPDHPPANANAKTIRTAYAYSCRVEGASGVDSESLGTRQCYEPLVRFPDYPGVKKLLAAECVPVRCGVLCQKNKNLSRLAKLKSHPAEEKTCFHNGLWLCSLSS